MRKVYSPLAILKQIDSYLINILSREQLTALLFLIVVAVEKNGSGEFEPKAIRNLVGKYFNGGDLFFICEILQKFGWGRLTCCKEKNPEGPPCLRGNWQDLHIGVEFWGYKD